jgi:HEAT repeat protein
MAPKKVNKGFESDLLVKRLTSSDPELREQGATNLVKMGPKAIAFKDEVGEMMDHKHWYVRLAASRALAHIGGDDNTPQPIEVAASKIEHADQHVKQIAMSSLQLMSERATVPPDTSSVAQRLDHTQASVRVAALDSLASMGTYSAPHAKTICSLVADDSHLVRRACVRSIARLGESVSEGAGAAARHLAHADNIIRRTASEAIVVLQPPDVAADAAAKILADENPKGREIAARTLGRLGAPAARHVDGLAQLLEDTDLSVRNAAIEAISSFGVAAEPYVSFVIDRLRHEDPSTRRDAVQVLRALGLASPKIAQDVFNQIDHAESMEMTPAFLRKACIQAFGGMGINVQPFLMPILDRLTDTDWSCQRAMVETIGELGPFVTDAAIDEITRCLWHSDPLVRRAAVEALGQMGEYAASVADSVEKCTDDDDEDVKEAARRVMLIWPQEEDEED